MVAYITAGSPPRTPRPWALTCSAVRNARRPWKVRVFTVPSGTPSLLANLGLGKPVVVGEGEHLTVSGSEGVQGVPDGQGFHQRVHVAPAGGQFPLWYGLEGVRRAPPVQVDGHAAGDGEQIGAHPDLDPDPDRSGRPCATLSPTAPRWVRRPRTWLASWLVRLILRGLPVQRGMSRPARGHLTIHEVSYCPVPSQKEQ